MDDVVITPVHYGGQPRRSRNLEERLWARFPALYRRQAAVVLRLNPRSRLRRFALRRAVLSGWASWDRRDLELNLVMFAPDAEFEFPPGMQSLGLGGPFRGHEGRIEAMEKLFEVWATELEPAYILDLGDRLLNLGFGRFPARASEVQLGGEAAQLVTVRDGLITRDQIFFSWEEGLRAAGLEPGAISLPSRARAPEAASSAG